MGENFCFSHIFCKNSKINLIYYIPKKNTIPGYKTKKLFNGIYTNDNVCNNLKKLEKFIIL